MRPHMRQGTDLLDKSRKDIYRACMNSKAQQRIRRLQLLSHPEGGWYRETYRASEMVQYNGQPRSASTAIYFLLEAGQISTLHRIDADEQWHHYEGQRLRIHVLTEDGYTSHVLGPLDMEGAQPHCWVPAGAWFGAEVIEPDGFALVGCTVAPGFEFSAFELADAETLIKTWPDQAALIQRMT